MHLAYLSLGLVASTYAASLSRVRDFGDNPGRSEMYIYVPEKLAEKPPIILALHGCLMDAQMYWAAVDFHTPADELGFITIFPSATRDFHCWDVYTKESLTHDGGSDSLSLVNMINYTINKYGADPERVYVTGSSSGAMMTQTLVATYPDVFAAGSAFSGLPYTCLLGSPGASPITADPACANGEVIKTGQEWANAVKEAYPGFSGKYPRLQIWHGTADSIINYRNFGEAVKQWSTFFDLDMTKEESNTPLPGYTRYVYGDGTQFEAYSAQGVGHVVPTPEDEVLKWFGLTE